MRKNNTNEHSIVRTRLVRDGDVDALYDLASKTGGGMTNLPMDRDDLLRRIERTKNSAKELGEDSVFLFLAENSKTHEPLGVAGLFVQAGKESGFYTYRLDTHVHASNEVDRRFEHKFLVLSNDYSTDAEIGAIFVDPAARGMKLGTTLVKACFLFVAMHRSIFPDRIFGEMRGWDGPNGEKPFWDEFLNRFFEMEFNHADHLNGTRGNYFLGHLLPRFPVYLAGLSDKVHSIIGVPHNDGRRAFDILRREGLEPDGHLDPFDLGPCLSCRIDNLSTVSDTMRNTERSLTRDMSNGLVAHGKGRDFECLYDAKQEMSLLDILEEHSTHSSLESEKFWVDSI